MVDFESIGHNMTNLQIQLANVFLHMIDTNTQMKQVNLGKIIQEKYFMFWNLGRAQGPSYFAKIEI